MTERFSDPARAAEREGEAPKRPGGAGRALWRRAIDSDYWVLGLAVVYVLAISPFAPDLTTSENLANVLSNCLPLLALATGQTFVLIAGGIDLSVTAIIALSSVTGAWVMTSGVALWGGAGWPAVVAGIAAMLAIGIVVGIVNGLGVTRLAIPPFMMTLTVMIVVSGFAIFVTQSKSIHNLPPELAAIARGGLGPIPYAAVVLAALAVGAHLVLTRRIFGRALYAVGMSAENARVAGVPVERTVLLAYVASGLAAALASVLYTARLETGSPILGQRVFLDVIGAAVIGGASLFGGKGTVAGTACGVLFITVMDNSFNVLGLSSFTVLMAKGAVILAAAVLDATRSRRLAAIR